MLEEDFRVLRVSSVAGVWIHHQLGVGQVLPQEKGVDRDNDDVFVSMHDKGSLPDVPQHGVSVLRGRGTPFADRVQLSARRFHGDRRVAIAALMNPNFPGTEKQLRDVEAAARMFGLRLIVLRAGTEREIETAFATMGQQGSGVLLVGVDPFLIGSRDQIIALAARHAIPAVYPVRQFAVSGGLMSYGTDFADSYRLAGVYTGRIVRGEKPADLPVQRSTKFELVINFKTAKALGLAVPNSMQLLADEVIE
jgi:ABC-type uncharacterized transport system substrate-binding protein